MFGGFIFYALSLRDKSKGTPVNSKASLPEVSLHTYPLIAAGFVISQGLSLTIQGKQGIRKVGSRSKVNNHTIFMGWFQRTPAS
jgi:hypothetical protein